MSSRSVFLGAFVATILFLGLSAAQTPSPTKSVAPVVREKLPGPFRFPDEPFLRIIGKPEVLDSHTLRFSDGTVVELNGTIEAPDLDQRLLASGKFEPVGREAAEFLRKLIGDREVVCLAALNEKSEKPGGQLRGHCFVNETNLQIEIIRNGWAISHHSAMEPWEAIARQQKRGLWRGEFVAPEDWRKGKRLPGE